MKVLFVVPYVPSLVRVRPYNLIRALQKRGHQVTVMTLWSSAEERQQSDVLSKVCEEVEGFTMPAWRSAWNCLLELPGSRPLQSVYSWQPDLGRSIGQRLRNGSGKSKYDIVHVEHLRGVQYALHVQGLQLEIPVVWDSVDSISHLFRQASQRSKKRLSRWITQFELRRTERYEGWLSQRFDRTLVTSKADRQALLDLAGARGETDSVTILPNGVDLEYFTPGASGARQPATLLLSGKMSYHANVSMAMDLVERVMPRVWAQNSDVRLQIVGKDPPREILALGEHPNIEISGTVPDLRPYLQKATLAVAPLTYGAGIQNKILEAMACATPVLTTPLGASALEARTGSDFFMAEGVEAFSALILEILGNPEMRSEVGASGRRYVEAHHQWGEVARKLEGIYHEVITARHRVLSRK